MQLDAEVTAWVGAVSGVVSALASGVGFHLVTREKVNRLENDVKSLQAEQDKFVTFKHLEMTVESIKSTLENVQAGMRVILDKILN